LELGTGAGVQRTRFMAPRKKLTISFADWIQYTNVTDGETDKQTDGHLATAKTALTHSVAR